MSSTELDLPLTPSADQIRRREFATIRRGYDPDQVRAYLSQIASQVEKLEEQARVAKMEAAAAKEAAPPISAPPQVATDPYEVLSGRLAGLLREAEKHAEEIGAEAEEEARRVLDEARAEADRVQLDAQSKAEEVRQEANDLLSKSRDEAERMISGLTSKREALLADLENMRERLLGVAKSLGAVADAAQKDPGGQERREPVAGPAAGSGSAWEATAPSSVSKSAPSSGADLFADPAFAELWAPGEEEPAGRPLDLDEEPEPPND